jgi:hypothetical protein
MMANIVGDDALGVGIGERVRVCFEKRKDGFSIPQFVREPKPATAVRGSQS